MVLVPILIVTWIYIVVKRMDKIKFKKVRCNQIFFMENTDTALAKIIPFPFRFMGNCDICKEGVWNATNFSTNVHICPDTEVLVTAYQIKEG